MFSLLLYVGLVSLVLGCGEDIGELKWVESTNNIAPDGNFPYGKDDSQGMYFICRGEIDGITYGGSYLQQSKTKICRVIKNGTLTELTTFEVLVCAPSSMWTPAFNKIIPNNAYLVGSDIMCRGVSTSSPAIGTIGKIRKCEEEGQITCTDTAACHTILPSKDGYTTGQIENFNVLTVTNKAIITNGDEEIESSAFLKPNETNLISFNAKAAEDLTITIRSDIDSILPIMNNTIFEILFGGLHNSITAVRTQSGEKYANSSYTPYVLDELTYVGFYLYWDKDTLAMGTATKYPSVSPARTPFLTHRLKKGLGGATKISLKSSKRALWHIFC